MSGYLIHEDDVPLFHGTLHQIEAVRAKPVPQHIIEALDARTNKGIPRCGEPGWLGMGFYFLRLRERAL